MNAPITALYAALIGLLFVACAIAKTSISKIVRPMIPMYIAMFLALMVVSYVPEFSEFLPRFFGLID